MCARTGVTSRFVEAMTNECVNGVSFSHTFNSWPLYTTLLDSLFFNFHCHTMASLQADLVYSLWSVSVTCDLYGSWISLARWRNKIPWWLVWSEYNLVLHLPSDVKLEYDFDYSFFTRSNVLLFKYWFSLLFMVCILLHFKNFTMIMHSTPMSYPVGFSHTCLWCNLAMGAHHRWESTWLIILVRIVWLGST